MNNSRITFLTALMRSNHTQNGKVDWLNYFEDDQGDEWKLYGASSNHDWRIVLNEDYIFDSSTEGWMNEYKAKVSFAFNSEIEARSAWAVLIAMSTTNEISNHVD